MPTGDEADRRETFDPEEEWNEMHEDIENEEDP